MTTLLDRYVDIQINLQADVVSRVGFGTLLFITVDTTETPGTMNGPYGSLAEVADDYANTTEPYKAALAAFSQGKGFSSFKVFHAAISATDYGTEVTNAIDADPDWYCLTIDSNTDADITAAAAAIQTTSRLFIARTNAVTAIADALGDTLTALNYTRTALIRKDGQYADTAWAGRVLPETPGTMSWAYRTLIGITPDVYTSAQLAGLETGRCNYYMTIAGREVTFGGFTCSDGFFIDIIRVIDELKQRMQEDIVARQASDNPIPYRGTGAAVIDSIIRSALQVNVDRETIEPDFTVTVPAASSQSTVDRANRFFPGITFTADLVGFANKIQIVGTLVV